MIVRNLQFAIYNFKTYIYIYIHDKSLSKYHQNLQILRYTVFNDCWLFFMRDIHFTTSQDTIHIIHFTRHKYMKYS